jgi:prevent-host-death family protein
MKTISLRELHNNTGKWAERVSDEKEIVITKRGVVIAKLVPPSTTATKKKTWANRTVLPEYAALLKSGKLDSDIDSSIGISEDRTSRDNSVAGMVE